MLMLSIDGYLMLVVESTLGQQISRIDVGLV